MFNIINYIGTELKNNNSFFFNETISNIQPPKLEFLFFFLISQLIVILFLTFPLPFYLCKSPRVFLFLFLISLFLYFFIFLYFLIFVFPFSYYKFTIIFPILYIVFLHTKVTSLSFSLIFPLLVDFYFYFSCISTLGWWIFVLFGTLFWFDVIKFHVFKLLSFLFSLIS